MGGMGALWGEGGSLWVGVDSWWVEGGISVLIYLDP